LIGYTSSVAIIFQAATAVGANQAEINSWLLSLGLGMAVTCIGLSFYYKKPILTAWSTPGAALLATSLVGVSMSDAIGAFMFSALLMILSGVTGSFERISKIISPAIAAAMLAGVLLQFCLEIFTYIQEEFILVAYHAQLFTTRINQYWYPIIYRNHDLAEYAGCGGNESS